MGKDFTSSAECGEMRSSQMVEERTLERRDIDGHESDGVWHRGSDGQSHLRRERSSNVSDRFYLKKLCSWVLRRYRILPHILQKSGHCELCFIIAQHGYVFTGARRLWCGFGGGPEVSSRDEIRESLGIEEDFDSEAGPTLKSAASCDTDFWTATSVTRPMQQFHIDSISKPADCIALRPTAGGTRENAVPIRVGRNISAHLRLQEAGSAGSSGW
jgi:hypothetical protein